MSSASDSQNISEILFVMFDSDLSFDCSLSSSPVVSASTLVIDNDFERRTKNRHDCSTSGRDTEEPALRVSPLGSLVALGDALGVPTYDQYRTMVGIAEHSPQLFPPGEASLFRPAGLTTEGEARTGPSHAPGEASPVNSEDVESVLSALCCRMRSSSLWRLTMKRF